ncbi:MAG: threonine synthase [Promethearchaeota archaeon]
MFINDPLIFTCNDCNKEFSFTIRLKHLCNECGGILWFKPNISNYKKELFQKRKFSKFWDYYFTFPQIEKDFIVTLGEGGTPLRASKKLGARLGVKNLFFKDETQNPTSSFKDRAAALLISHARSLDYHKVVCASNGNQGASIAAYTSLEGMECVNIIPEDIDVGKRAQMIAYNSKIIIDGQTVDDALKDALSPKYDKYYQCTPEYNPLTIEAQKTIAYEILEQIEKPEWIIVPMGSGGLLISLWKAFLDLKEVGIIQEIPRLVGVQSQMSSPIVNKYDQVEDNIKNTKEIIKSHALGVLVKNPVYLDIAIKAIKDTKGVALAIPENLIISSSEDLARNEGIFAEPASALTIAALNSLIQREEITPNDNIACIITGSGLKTPHVLEALSTRAKTAGPGGILSTKLKILSQISLSDKKGIHGSRLKEIIGSISLPAIYQHLKELESKNLILRKKEGKNVFYSITEKGKKVLDALDILITLL